MGLADQKGHLIVIGGHEDKEGEKAILRRFVELSGGRESRVVVLTTASRLPEEMADTYEHVLEDCGAGRITSLHIADRLEANDPDLARQVAGATGVFMTGGDQSKLVSTLGGSEVAKAMHLAFALEGACIAGTSAGASAMSEHMVAGGEFDVLPKKGMLSLVPGLGFLHRVIIDQHFSQRQRLGRLLSVIAENPYLLGVGIDEDTAIVVVPDSELEVVGTGAVTIVDGRHMVFSNFNEVADGDVLALSNVQLHLLPAGVRFRLSDRDLPERLRATPLMEVLETVVESS